MKRIKNEAIFLQCSNEIHNYSMMNMSSILNNNNNIQANQQNYSSNSYTNGYGGITNSNNINYNYSNSYYDWTSSSNCSQLQIRNQQTTVQCFSNSTANNTTNLIENSLDTSVRDLIKIIYQSYQVYLSSLLPMLKDELNKNSSHYNYNRLDQNQYQANGAKKCMREIMDYLRFYARKFASFSENIPGLGKLENKSDKEELIKCSIHSVILLSLQRNCDHFNYFNEEPSKIDRFQKDFPILLRTNYFMKTINEKFEKFKLDDKEYALYSALLVISTGILLKILNRKF